LSSGDTNTNRNLIIRRRPDAATQEELWEIESVSVEWLIR